MSMAYVRRYYGVPARRGRLVQSTWADSEGVEYGEADLAARAVLAAAAGLPLDMVRDDVQHSATFSKDPGAKDDAESFLAVLNDVQRPHPPTP